MLLPHDFDIKRHPLPIVMDDVLALFTNYKSLHKAGLSIVMDDVLALFTNRRPPEKTMPPICTPFQINLMFWNGVNNAYKSLIFVRCFINKDLFIINNLL